MGIFRKALWWGAMVGMHLGTMGWAHEPVFGLGPHTLYQYGLGVEFETQKIHDNWHPTMEILYGVTPNFSATLALPFQRPGKAFPPQPENLVLRGKYRFYKRDMPGASHQAALHGGVIVLPSNGDEAGNSAFPNVFMGLSVGRESRRHYGFVAVRMRWNRQGSATTPRGVLKLDAAYGIRPWLLTYRQPDPVFLVEINVVQRLTSHATAGPSGGRNRTHIFLSPALLFSYRNIMIKAGWKNPLFGGKENLPSDPTREIVLGVEIHFPPFR